MASSRVVLDAIKELVEEGFTFTLRYSEDTCVARFARDNLYAETKNDYSSDDAILAGAAAAKALCDG